MAQLTRKFLKALGIEEEDKQDAIISAHVDTLDAIKAERDALKDDAAKLTEAQASIDTLTKELEAAKAAGGDATKVRADFDAYKQQVESEKTNAVKVAAIKAALLQDGCNQAVVDLLIPGDLSKVEMDGDKLKDAKAVIDPIKAARPGVFGSVQTLGTPPLNPPGGAPSGSMTKEAYQKLPLLKQMEYANAHPTEMEALLA